MNDKFKQRIKEYLDSECNDFDLTYTLEWNEDSECCEVIVKRDDYTQRTKSLNFRYKNEDDDLTIELSEDSFYVTREFDYTVRYFWILVSPALFHN